MPKGVFPNGCPSQFKKGQIAWNKGMKMNYSVEAQSRQSRLGIRHTEEAKQKMRLASAGRKGSESFKWKGGITDLNRRIRTCRKYHLWRGSILLEDNYTCRFCGKRGGKLHVDHIIPFAMKMRVMKITTFDEAMACQWLWETKGGRTLCVPCHRATPTQGYHRKEYGKWEGYSNANHN